MQRQSFFPISVYHFAHIGLQTNTIILLPDHVVYLFATTTLVRGSLTTFQLQRGYQSSIFKPFTKLHLVCEAISQNHDSKQLGIHNLLLSRLSLCAFPRFARYLRNLKFIRCEFTLANPNYQTAQALTNYIKLHGRILSMYESSLMPKTFQEPVPALV